MCSNYQPLTDPDLLLAHFGTTLPDGPRSPDGPGTWAPFIAGGEARVDGAQARLGMLGLLPHFAADAGLARHTQHCAVETMKSKPAFRESWWAGRRCLIPAQSLRAWCYEAGWPEPWQIRAVDGQPLALAGLWSDWTGPRGERLPSFCLLTLAAEGHGVFGRLGAPDQPRRMPVLLPAGVQQLWLHGSLKDAERQLQRYPAAQLQAEPGEPLGGPAGGRMPRGEAAMPDLFAPEWHELVIGPPRPLPPRARRVLTPRPLERAGPVTGELF